MFALKVIRSHGLAASWGFTGAGDRNRIGAFLARVKRRAFLAPQSPDPDARLFSAVVSNKNHGRRSRLPVKRPKICEPRGHDDSIQPTKDEQNFPIRLQYPDVYRKFITAMQGEKTGWQSERTELECNRYMLENEIATDVCFEVGPPGGAVVNIRAHKYMLISHSCVFEAMFSSGMSECNNGPDQKIRINDIEADTFKDLLMYIYCGHANIAPDASFPLMYTARKYMIPKLAELCHHNLEKIINESNACYMLEQSVVFCDEELASKCVNIIAIHSDKFLSESELLSASRKAMEVILASNELRSRESLVYEFCLRWAEEQLLIHQSIQNPTDEQIRETLGGLLYQIRFTIMDPEEFAKLVGQRNILSLEEKLSLYNYLHTGTGTGMEQLMFCNQKRKHICGKGEELCVDRVAMRAYGGSISSDYAIDFSTNENVVLTGVGLYTGICAEYFAEIEVFEQDDTVYRDHAVTVPFTDDPVPFKTSLRTPIPIMAGVEYRVFVKMPNRNTIGYRVEMGYRICEKDGVKFTFLKTDLQLQIPHLYFKKV